jgi:hypothetical protein
MRYVATQTRAAGLRSWRPAAPLVLTLSLVLAGPGGIARAQEVDQARSTSVSEREATNNTAAGAGIRLGSFTLRPTLRVDSELNDNIYATDTDRRGDIYLVVRPEAAISSDFGSNAVGASAYLERSQHAKYTGEDVTQYGGTINGRYDIMRTTRLSALVQIDRAAESRGSLGTFRQTSTPAQFTSLIADATLNQEFGPFALAATGRVRKLSYSDALLGSARIDQSYRNVTIRSGTVAASYGFHELTSLIVVGMVERRRYALRDGDAGYDPARLSDQSADGFRIEAGLSREITSLLTGSVRIGYLRYRYADPRLRDIAGLSYFGDLNWNVTRLTTITAAASRRLDETTSPVTAGNLRDEFRLGVDHELLRRMILSADVRGASIRPSNAVPSSQEFEVSAGARYYLNRHLRLEALVRHADRSSRDRSVAFRANSVLIGLRLTR